jgi:hypothetical protein
MVVLTLGRLWGTYAGPMLARRDATSVVLLVLALTSVACSSATRTTTSTTAHAASLLPHAVLDPSCEPQVETFEAGRFPPEPSPLQALSQFLESYDHDALLGLTLSQAVPPGSRPVPPPLPASMRTWVVHLDARQRIVLVIHSVDGPDGWYVHDLQRCGSRASPTTAALTTTT